MINDKLYELEPVQNGNNLKINGWNDTVDNDSQEYFFYGESKDNKGNTDKTKAGITYNIFAKNQTVNGKQIQQFYHGGSGRKLNNETKEAYNQDLIKEKESFTLFYTREISDLNNESSLLIGLGEIQNKIGVLDTSDRIKGSKIYCYDHYDGSKYHLFRFPYQELIYIANNNVNNQKDSAKQFLEELVEPLSIENSDKPFFSKEQSKIIPNALVLKYANRLYEQIMKLKQNNSLWEAVQKASKQDPQAQGSQNKWHFCDDEFIRFLKLSIEKLKQAQLKQKNPGLWALKEYLHISNNASETEIQLQDQYENFIRMCSGESVRNFSLDNLFECSNTDLKGYIINNLTNYPINNPETIKRIFLHLGIKIEIKKTENNNYFLYDVSQFIIENKSLCNLIDDVKNDRNLYNNQKNIEYRGIVHKSNAIIKYLQKSTIFSINKDLYEVFIDQENIPDNICGKLCLHTSNLIDINEILKNPYLLFEKYIQNDDAPLLLDDIDWGQKIILKEKTDEAKKLFEENPYRLRAIVVEYIKKQENQTGHVWVSYEDAQEYLNDRLFELDGKLDEFYKIVDLIDKDEFKEVFEIEDKFLTLKEFASREEYINGVISGLINSSHLNSNKVLAELKKAEQDNPDNKFIESEKSLIKMKNLDFVFISGVAGSGKSHTLCKYLDILLEEKITDFKVLTPSGKAADVLKNKIKNSKDDFKNIWNHFYTEENDKETEHISKISTADRYIVDSGKFWDQKLFARVDKNNSKATEDSDLVLIIDEISMISLDTLYYILKIKQPKKLIILGDIKQLPPIGYGSLATSIYNHLFLESSFQDICLAKMETSHRADDNSLFIKHSLTLRDKSKQLKEEDLKKEDKSKNFILQAYSNETLEKMLEKIYSKEMLEKIYSEENGSDIFKANIQALNKEIQILTPNRIGDSGTNAINNIFIKALGEEKVGLKFIWINNDKKSGLTNGNIGYIDKDKDKEIDFDGKEVYFSESQLGSDYDYGFAITVHKSQGSGFPIVILVLPEKNNSLITKELIYTALTRPEQKMYILYHKDNIKALTHLPSIPHRNMNIFERDKILWEKETVDYPITYNKTLYRKKQDLYFALMLEYSKIENVNYHKNGSFVWKINNEEMLLMPKFYIEEKQDEKSFKYLKSINLIKVYENFKLNIAGNNPKNRVNENKVDIIEDNNNSIEITTHNGLRTRSWSEAILMLIFDKLKIPYYYEVELRREKDTNGQPINTYKLTYSNLEKEPKIYRIPDFTIVSKYIENFQEEKQAGSVKINDVKFIIEHLGMLSNEDYKKGWQEKVKDYYTKYKFDLVAPLCSLNYNHENKKYTIDQKWEDKDVELCKNAPFKEGIEISDMKICFTTDEEDINDLKTLTEKLGLLKDLYKIKEKEE